ncbi:hypothetical protein MRX96_003907 [Rhipicephalus microplus]
MTPDAFMCSISGPTFCVWWCAVDERRHLERGRRCSEAEHPGGPRAASGFVFRCDDGAEHPTRSSGQWSRWPGGEAKEDPPETLAHLESPLPADSPKPALISERGRSGVTFDC